MQILKSATQTLQALVQGRPGNNLNALRLLLAALVILAHSFPLATGQEGDPLYVLSHGQATFGGLAVNLFFFISGLLITASWLNSRSMNDYLRRRVLRIVPGYLCALGFSFVIASLFALHHFADLPARLARFGDVVLLGYHGVSGDWIFPNNVYPHQGNGSLWTIGREFFCYLVIAGVGLFGLFKHRGLLLAVFLLFFAYYSLTLLKGGDIEYSDRRFLTFFLAGACAWLWRDKLPIHAGLAVVALVIAVGAARFTPLFLVVQPVAACYLVLWAGFAFRVPAFAWCDRTDLSYGTYLYAFPVQQALSALGVGNPWVLFLIATPVVLGVAWFSWVMVEKPCLKLKSKDFTDRDPGLAAHTKLATPVAAEAKSSW